MKKGNRIAKGAIEFEESDGILAGFHLVGFTICEDEKQALFVMFPASTAKGLTKEENKTFFFLRPNRGMEQIEKLESLILDAYDDMVKINRIKA